MTMAINPTVRLNEENLERLQRIGHLHCPAEDRDVLVTLQMEEEDDKL